MAELPEMCDTCGGNLINGDCPEHPKQDNRSPVNTLDTKGKCATTEPFVAENKQEQAGGSLSSATYKQRIGKAMEQYFNKGRKNE